MYLDDLEKLQENDVASMKWLLEALTSGESAYLLSKTNGDWVDVNKETGESTFVIAAGCAVVKGELVEWEETKIKVPDWDTPLYLHVEQGDTDRRAFKDGQVRPCRTETKAYLSTDNTGDCYAFFDLPKMRDLMRKALGVTDEPSYKNLDVNFYYDYSGTVAYKELSDAYRYKIDIKSSNNIVQSGSVRLFYAETIPGANDGAFYTPTRAFVKTENGVQSFGLYAVNGAVFADVQLPLDGVNTCAGLPVKMIFELPK